MRPGRAGRPRHKVRREQGRFLTLALPIGGDGTVARVEACGSRKSENRRQRTLMTTMAMSSLCRAKPAKRRTSHSS